VKPLEAYVRDTCSCYFDHEHASRINPV
jgi:hypothetical protein